MWGRCVSASDKMDEWTESKPVPAARSEDVEDRLTVAKVLARYDDAEAGELLADLFTTRRTQR